MRSWAIFCAQLTHILSVFTSQIHRTYIGDDGRQIKATEIVWFLRLCLFCSCARSRRMRLTS